MLIAFEGCDRSGKSSQIQLIFEYLTKEKGLADIVEKRQYPDRTSHTGKLLDDYLNRRVNIDRKEAVHLLFSANRWENQAQLEKSLEEGKLILVDRYKSSGLAFSMAKVTGNFKISRC